MKRARGVRAVLGAVCAVGVLAVASCSTARVPEAAPSSSVPVSEHIPPDFDTTYRWIASPVLDLLGPEGTFVRAYVESFELANAGESVSWGYNGFEQASPSNIATMIAFYPSDVSASRPGVGTTFFTALRRLDNGDWTRIVLCRYGYHSVRDGSDPVAAWRSETDAPRPVEIDFRRLAAPPPTVTRGTQRTPDGNVFGSWYTTRYDFSAVYPTPTDDQRACAANVPAEVPQREPAQGARPWPAMAPSPGWSTTVAL